MHNRKMFLIIVQKESHIIIITALKKIYIYMHIYICYHLMLNMLPSAMFEHTCDCEGTRSEQGKCIYQ